ncbi:hypothetical protein N7528_008713 [Penicillium herquei]|nr:hypothetical protein N7528_008713 [Penicillium herquei]
MEAHDGAVVVQHTLQGHLISNQRRSRSPQWMYSSVNGTDLRSVRFTEGVVKKEVDVTTEVGLKRVGGGERGNGGLGANSVGLSADMVARLERGTTLRTTKAVKRNRAPGVLAVEYEPHWEEEQG